MLEVHPSYLLSILNRYAQPDDIRSARTTLYRMNMTPHALAVESARSGNPNATAAALTLSISQELDDPAIEEKWMSAARIMHASLKNGVWQAKKEMCHQPNEVAKLLFDAALERGVDARRLERTKPPKYKSFRK